MSETDGRALPPGSSAVRGDRILPPSTGSGPLNKGRRGIADVLERAGQKDGAEYVRALDIDGLDREVQQRVRQMESGVRARPLVSVLAAIVAGFVIGRVLRD